MRHGLLALCFLTVLSPGCAEPQPVCDLEIHSSLVSREGRFQPAPLPWDALAEDAPDWLVAAMADRSDRDVVRGHADVFEWAQVHEMYVEQWHAFYGDADPDLEDLTIRDWRMYLGDAGETVRVAAEWPDTDCQPIQVH